MKAHGNITVVVIVLLTLVAAAMVAAFVGLVSPSQLPATDKIAASTTDAPPEILDDRLTRRTTLPVIASTTAESTTATDTPAPADSPPPRVKPRPTVPTVPATPEHPNEPPPPEPAPASRPAEPPRTPSSPREACADRPNAVSRTLCEQRMCAQANWRNHPSCEKYREENRPPPGV